MGTSPAFLGWEIIESIKQSHTLRATNKNFGDSLDLTILNGEIAIIKNYEISEYGKKNIYELICIFNSLNGKCAMMVSAVVDIGEPDEVGMNIIRYPYGYTHENFARLTRIWEEDINTMFEAHGEQLKKLINL